MSRKSRTSPVCRARTSSHEVVDDVVVVAGEAGDERAGVVPPLQRQRGQLQGGDPALGTTLERADVVGGQPQAHRAVEIGRGLVGREAQVGRPHLHQLTAGAQLGQRQRRVGAGGEDQMQPRRLVLEDERHSVVHLRRVEHVVVVQHEDDLRRHGFDLVEQCGERRLRHRRGRGQQLQRRVADPGHRRLEGGHQVRPEQRGVVVPAVQGQPGDRRAGRGRRAEPFGEQRRLAEAGRRGQDGERRPGRAAQPFGEPTACDRTGPPRRTGGTCCSGAGRPPGDSLPLSAR